MNLYTFLSIGYLVLKISGLNVLMQQIRVLPKNNLIILLLV